MRIPDFIRKGDTIGLAAPSFGVSTEPYITRLEAAVSKFRALGYNVMMVPSCMKNLGTCLSNAPEIAARELMDMYLDDRVDAVISVGGGELMCETISHVDFRRLSEAKPKWYMGYSDNTNFIYPMLTLGDVAGIYGPCAPGFGKPWEGTEDLSFALLEGRDLTVKGFDMFESPDYDDDDPLRRYHFDTKKELTLYAPVNGKLLKTDEVMMEGVLSGGCLDILINLSGTRFDGTQGFLDRHEKVILVMEACDLTPLDIRRGLWQLRERGWMRNLTGIVFGRPLNAFNMDQFGVDRFTACLPLLEDLGVSVIFDADIGHIDPMVPLIMGADTIVTAKGNDITFDMRRRG